MTAPGEIAVAAPPRPPHPARGRVLSGLLPVVMAVGMLLMTAVAYRSGSPRGPTFLAFPLMMLASLVTAALNQRNRHDIDADRDEYLGYLGQLRLDLLKTAAEQREALWRDHPAPDAVWTLAGGSRMWQRRPDDAAFGRVRVGTGAVPLATRLVPPPDPAGRVDPVTHTALRRLLDTHATVPDAPVTITLPETAAIALDGDPGLARGLLRAMLCQLAVLHGPDHLTITAAVSDSNRNHWEWLKWLPHQRTTSVGQFTVMVVDGVVTDAISPGVTVLKIGGTGPGMVLRVLDDALTVRRADRENLLARPDWLTQAEAAVCARRLAGYPSRASGAAQGWAGLIGVGNVKNIDPKALWRTRACGRLSIPLGIATSGGPAHLDIKEAAENGMGPHGLCIGATGSGKSELLRTIALGMLTRHAPDELNLVLVDFKGGATFLGMERARHVAAVITNLSGEATLVARMRDALAGELHRRQELLRAAGNFVSAAAYNNAGTLPALPALLVIVDEFSELLHQHPDFVDMFVAIGRLGRSLGIHLLLASQRLDEGRLRGLESHLSYRICLKTLSASESRAVLGVPDAHQLPNTPGLGFLRSADGELTRFQTAFVSGPCPAGTVDDESVRLFTGAAENSAPAPDTGGPTVLHTVLDQLCGHGSPAHRLWLPPLGAAPTLGSLLDQESDSTPLVVPIGIVDRPFDQQRTPLHVDVRGAAGHVAVVGAPQSGKSTALSTLITALAATHDAAFVQFYCLDFGGGALAGLRSLPHVGSVAGRAEPELVRRTVSEIEQIIARREAHPTASFPHVFLVIDGWAGLCREFDTLEAPVVALAGRGLSFGVHVVLSASRWAEIRPALRDQIGTRIELRLGEPADSELDRRQAQLVPADRPGRGLTRGGLHTLIAVPEPGRAISVGEPAPPVRLLPQRVSLAGLTDCSPKMPVLGIDERGLDAVTIAFERQAHLLILGDNECGKTTVLNTLCRELVRTSTPDQAQLMVIDYRRTLLGVVEPDHLGGYAISTAAVNALLPDLVDRLARRMPGPEVTQQQLRDRSWWSGPQLYLVVDDYDLVATAGGNPLSALLEYLPHAGDLGLRLVIARRSGGAARALYEPLLAALRDLGCMGLVMSGSPDEGPLLEGVRPVPLPAGRGTLLSRTGGEQLIQVALSDPP